MKKTVFVSLPIRGNAVTATMDTLRRYYRQLAYEEGVEPVIPHLLAFYCLDDATGRDRELGTASIMAMFERGAIDEMWLYGERISQGMFDDIHLAERYGVLIVPKTRATAEAFLQYEEARMGAAFAG